MALDRWSPGYLAYELITKKIKKGKMDVNKRLEFILYETPTILHFAIYLDDDKFVGYLLENNADINVNCVNWGTALHVAVSMKKKKLVRKLVSRGADVNVRALGVHFTPLHLAVKNGSHDIAKFLINCGANTHAVFLDKIKNKTVERNILQVALKKKDKKMVGILLESGVFYSLSNARPFWWSFSFLREC